MEMAVTNGTFRALDPKLLVIEAELIGSSVSPETKTDIWYLVPSPKDEALFFSMNGSVWWLSTNGTSASRRRVWRYAGPWNDISGANVDMMPVAIEDFEEAGVLRPGDNGGKLPRRILHIADNGMLELRAWTVPPTGPGIDLDVHRDNADVTGYLPRLGLVVDSRRRVMYISTQYAIYRMNLTRNDVHYREVELWIGPDAGNRSSNYTDGDNPQDARFSWPVLSPSAISADGRVLYVADQNNCVVRRIRTRTGAVDTIAGNGCKTDGPAVNSTFGLLRGMALTSDGCNLFVSDSFEGSIRLIEFNQSGGAAMEVRTVAKMDVKGRKTAILYSLAVSPGSETLYVAAFDGQIFQLAINKSALRSCAPDSQLSPPPSPLLPSLPPSKPRPPSSANALPVALSAALLVVFALVAVLALFIWRRRRRTSQQWKSSNPKAQTDKMRLLKGTTTITVSSLNGQMGSKSCEETPQQVRLKPTSTLRRYTLADIASACNDFSAACLVGKGGAAEVYRGVLPSGHVVAIKMMKGAEFSAARFRQFQAELDVLAALRHSQICSIIGYCAQGGKSLIIYPFVEGGTLYDRLHSDRRHVSSGWEERRVGTAAQTGREAQLPPRSCHGAPLARAPPDWKFRLSVARQIASALRYLHEEVDPLVIHRDVKSKNVLLEDHGEEDWKGVRAYLADFGLAKQGETAYGKLPARETLETHHVAGTLGYMAPEYYTALKLTSKNDVYEYGVLLLELITGREAFAQPGPPPRVQGVKQQQQQEEEEQEEEEEEEEEEKEGGYRTLTSWVKRKLRRAGSLPSESDVEEEEEEEEDNGKSPGTRRINRGERRRRRRKMEKYCPADTLDCHRIREIADPRLEALGAVDWTAVHGMVELATLCTRTNPGLRPQMGEVMERLARLEESS